MINKIIFQKITFNNFQDNDFEKIVLKKGYFVFPAAPALITIENSKKYYESLLKADYVFFDSGFFVLLLKIIKNISVNRFSGYKFLKFFFKYLKKNKNKIIFSIDPNNKSLQSNRSYFKKLGINKIYNYVAKNYASDNIVDKKLLNLIKKVKPNFIIINIGGGKQEILASFLKKNLKNKQTIICTGAAISFFTGDGEPVNSIIDKIYLGWLTRLTLNPKIFLKKYIKSLYLFKMVIKDKIMIK